ncbi:MAG: hypothetical protein PHC45_04155, partial [Clostridiaceae bacterium]|nr:hypothetical protein [Clostridiaceae bacterium]
MDRFLFIGCESFRIDKGVSNIQYFILIQAIAIALLIAVVSVFVYQYFRYQKIKRLYRADYARKSCLKSISGFLPNMPRYKSRRYRNTETLIINSGLRISVEEFFLAKTLLFILGFIFFVSVQTTNMFIHYDDIIGNLNMEKTLFDPIEPSNQNLQLEKEVFMYIDSSLPKREVTLKELKKESNSEIFIEYIETQIKSKWAESKEHTGEIAERMYKKLIKIRKIEADYLIYLTSLIASIILYFIPNIIG